MTLAQMYEGDDKELAALQFRHYLHAANVINNAVAQAYHNACKITGVEPAPNNWPIVPAVDYRTIERVHDRLAAVWRYKVSHPEAALFDPAPDAHRLSMSAWEAWLRDEILSWAIDRPDLIRFFVQLFQNENCELGYQAEERLDYELAERWPIAWSQDVTGDE